MTTSQPNNLPRKRQRLWKQILNSSKALDNAASSSDWESLTPLIEARLRLLRQFFSEPLASEHSKQLEQIRVDLEAMLEQTETNNALCRNN